LCSTLLQDLTDQFHCNAMASDKLAHNVPTWDERRAHPCGRLCDAFSLKKAGGSCLGIRVESFLKGKISR
jgi:hypothetical protein